MAQIRKRHISKNTVKVLREAEINIFYHNRNEKYSRKKYITYKDGYDFLENMILVRPYIQKRYKISVMVLEMLLYLRPKLFFTQMDFRQMPKKFQFGRVKNLLSTGFVDTLKKGDNLSTDLFAISRKGIEIVDHFYECLSGEVKIPENHLNPMTKTRTATGLDKKRMLLIKKLNSLPAPESKKYLYQ